LETAGVGATALWAGTEAGAAARDGGAGGGTGSPKIKGAGDESPTVESGTEGICEQAAVRA